jgi:predicted nucleic acid-binding protein
MPRLYLDACCLNRPFDDQAQERIRLEAEAALLILGRVQRGSWRWISSEVLEHELSRMPDPERRRRVEVLLGSATEKVLLTEEILARGADLETLGFGAFDALHLAAAEAAGADVFLTTDDGLLRRARRQTAPLSVRVENPLVWLEEETRL